MNADLSAKYTIDAFIANGTFGHVFKAHISKQSKKVAWKRIPKVTKKLSREFRILETIKNKQYLIQLIEVFYTINSNNQIIQNLIFPFYETDLENMLKRQRIPETRLNYLQIKRLLFQVTLGLGNLHKEGICHRDLKPENVLYNNSEISITDFGSSKVLGRYNTPYAVSRYYRSPELLLGIVSYTISIDVWSLGVMLYEFVFDSLPFRGKTEGQQLVEIFKCVGVPEKKVFEMLKEEMCVYDSRFEVLKTLQKNSKFAKDFDGLAISTEEKQKLERFLEDCFEYDFKKRMNGVEAARHGYFSDLIEDGSRSCEKGFSN